MYGHRLAIPEPETSTGKAAECGGDRDQAGQTRSCVGWLGHEQDNGHSSRSMSSACMGGVICGLKRVEKEIAPVPTMCPLLFSAMTP